ncbi:hypothetical protein ACFL4X_01635, partial [Gemmatimonadota bacterium]
GLFSSFRYRWPGAWPELPQGRRQLKAHPTCAGHMIRSGIIGKKSAGSGHGSDMRPGSLPRTHLK